MLKSQIRRYSLAVLGASQGGEAGQKVEKLGSKRQCPKGKESSYVCTSKKDRSTSGGQRDATNDNASPLLGDYESKLKAKTPWSPSARAA